VPDGEQVDRGRARERTVLAWNRSGLALVVCTAVLLRRLWPLRGTSQMVALGVTAAVVVVLAPVVLVHHLRRRGRDDRGPLGPRAMILMTAGTVALAVGGITLALATPA